ncbi:TPA: hypothetical protein GXZ54_01345 [bacterium]|jgi:dUTP pyrophosphatase|nr:hypothetical protein [bacterium]
MKFYKVSLENYQKFRENNAEIEYQNIFLPRRSTTYAAGYDFFAPFDILIKKGETKIIPTGIKCELDPDKVLLLFVRSSLGIKKHLSLANGTGVIDADYFNNESNEGHILAAITNNGDEDIIIEKGQHFIQGVIIKYFITEDDETSTLRTGGIGSTNK